MIPEGRLSTAAVPGAYLSPQSMLNPLRATERGGVALNDSSQGIDVKLWTLEYDKQTGDMLLSAPGVPTIVLFNRPEVESVSLAFDRNMNPAVAFVQAGQAKFWWYDSVPGAMVFWENELGVAVSPRLTHDDKRDTQSGISDVILSYLRGGSLYYRQQRDRYLTEYLLQEGLGESARLVGYGMSAQLRLQWQLRDANGVDGAFVRARPTLADIIRGECARVGIFEDQLDVSQILEIEVSGYKIASEQTPADIISQLQGIYFFDVSEWDGKIHFIPRGGRTVASIGPDDLAETDGDAIEVILTQEVELVRKLIIGYVDETAGYAVNTQFAERRSYTVNAQGEKTYEVPVTMSPDEGKQTAEKAQSGMWAEMTRFKFRLPSSWSWVTCGDVVDLTDKRGVTRSVRIYSMLEDSGVIAVEAVENCPWAYVSNATGAVTLPTGTGGTSGMVGDTDFVVLNLPSWDGSDELGFYMAGTSVMTGWRGADVQVKSASIPVTDVGDLVDKATVLTVLDGLLPEISAEYPSVQTLLVVPNADAEGLVSVDYATLLQNNNRAAVQLVDGSWEILQFQTVTDNGDTTYTLSGLVRGRYNTTPGEVGEAARMVLLDSAVVFIPLQSGGLDLTGLQVRATSVGKTYADDWGWTTPDLDPWAVQTEWPVASVSATRDGSNNVTVTWIPRPRLGVETAPAHSKYFAGYRVTYSDAQSFDVGRDATSHVRTSAPAGLTVTVAPLNTLTGAGPASESIPT